MTFGSWEGELQVESDPSLFVTKSATLSVSRYESLGGRHTVISVP